MVEQVLQYNIFDSGIQYVVQYRRCEDGIDKSAMALSKLPGSWDSREMVRKES